MENIKITKLLQYHELLRGVAVPLVENGDIGAGLSNYLGAKYTSHDCCAGEALLELTKNYVAGARILIIHDSDQDGVVAALILEDYLKVSGISEDVSLVEIGSGSAFFKNAEETVSSYDDDYAVFILDHSFNAELYGILKNKFSHVVWVDHHLIQEKDDVEIRIDNDTIFITDVYSTAELTWRMVATARSASCRPKELYVTERIAYLTHFHDTWQYKNGDGVLHKQLSKEAKDLSCWFDVEVRHTEILRQLFSFAGNATESIGFLTKLLQMGEAVTKSRELIQANIVKESVFFMTWKYKEHEYKIAYAFHSDGRSQLASVILDHFKEKINTAIVVFLSTRDGRARLTVRGTDDGPPVNVICELFNGGGHRNAAGFTVQPSDLGRYLQDQTFE